MIYVFIRFITCLSSRSSRQYMRHFVLHFFFLIPTPWDGFCSEMMQNCLISFWDWRWAWIWVCPVIAQYINQNTTLAQWVLSQYLPMRAGCLFRWHFCCNLLVLFPQTLACLPLGIPEFKSSTILLPPHIITGQICTEAGTHSVWMARRVAKVPLARVWILLS